MKVKLSKEEKKLRRQKKIQAIKQRLSNLKTKDKKEKAEKAYRPPGYIARKAGAGVFWIIFIGMFLFLFVLVTVNTSSKARQGQDIVEQTENPSVKPEAIQFAENFTKQYFTWEKGDQASKDREERLQSYLVKGIDKQAGLDLDSTEYGSQFNKAEVYKVQDVGDNKAYITFKVDATFIKTWQEEVEKKKKDGKKEKKVKEKVNKSEEKPFSKYFVVPVMYDNQRYAVFELPQFTQIENNGQLEVEKTEKLQSVSDSKLEKNIQEFLGTFFSSYASDPKDKLFYILEDKSVSNGLNGALNYVEVESADVYKGADKGQYRAFANVVFEDPDTKTKFTSEYDLLIEQRGNRFVVTKLNKQ